MAQPTTSTRRRGEPPALRTLYRRHLCGRRQGARLRATRAALRAQDTDQRVRQVQMALFYAICDRLVGEGGAAQNSVGRIVNRLFLSGAQRPPAHVAPAVRAYFRTLRSAGGYQGVIARIDPYIDAAGVEASMRLQYGTLDHLTHAEFVAEIALARQCEIEDPGFLQRVAESYGTRRRASR